MINELLSRIDAYKDRIHGFYVQREVFEPEEEYDDSAEDSDDRKYPPVPDVVKYDEAVWVIRGSIPDYDYPLKPLRYSVSPDNPWYFDIDGVVFSRETGLLIRFPPGQGGEYNIPDDERITGIGDLAFAGNRLLTKINLNSRIRYIGRKAFWDCPGLQEMIVPAETEYVGPGAFADCSSLEKVILNCPLKSIPQSCFMYDRSLETVRWADITEIEKLAFCGCTRLKDMKPIGQEESDCDVVIPTSVSSIGRRAFESCIRIRSVRLPDRMIDIGSDAFTKCSALEQINTEQVRSYGSSCFRECGALTGFTFGRNTVFLGVNMFWQAKNLKHIDFTCSPAFICDEDVLPADAEYTVDTRAYLSVQKPWTCRPVFKQCVMNIVGGESVPEELVLKAVAVLRRNRKRCFDWFLSDSDLLEWAFDRGILDSEDSLILLDMTQEDPQNAERILFQIRQRFTDSEMAAAQKRREEKKQKRIEAELEKQRVLEEQKRERELRDNDPNISLEAMDLSLPAYNCLKRHGVNTLYEVAAMTEEQLLALPDLGQWQIREIREKVEYLIPGGLIPGGKEPS